MASFVCIYLHLPLPKEAVGRIRTNGPNSHKRLPSASLMISTTSLTETNTDAVHKSLNVNIYYAVPMSRNEIVQLHGGFISNRHGHV